jgi:prepilin-type N-terminal cleavage/methylation domain-containing protein
MTSRANQKGLTLIEVLIVLAVIGLLAAILIPTFKTAMQKANEANAVTAINTIKAAQAKYVIDHKGQYGTFADLVRAGHLDRRFDADRPVNKGYVFVMELVDHPNKSAVSFKLNVNPEVPDGVGATGTRYYYSEPDSAIFVSADGPANSASEIL